jgi:hypothetical protein
LNLSRLAGELGFELLGRLVAERRVHALPVATMMLMAGMTPAFCAKHLGHSVEMFLRTYAKWMDGSQNTLEMGRLEVALAPDLSQIYPKKASKRLTC